MRDRRVNGGEGTPDEVLDTGGSSDGVDEVLSSLVLPIMRVLRILFLGKDVPEVGIAEYSVRALQHIVSQCHADVDNMLTWNAFRRLS